MRKNTHIFSIILAFFATISITFAQTVVKLTKEERYLNGLAKVDFSPSAVFNDPTILLNTWMQSPMPLSFYSKKDIETQKAINLNYQINAGFATSYCDIDDKLRYKENNASLPIEQRSVDNEPITPYTWKVVDFERIDADGARTVVNLARPNWWIQQLKADKVGNDVYLQISEQGISGNFKVKNIRTISLDTRFIDWEVKDNLVARPLTGKFEHQSTDVWLFEFDNGEIIGCTPTHPFYSEKRQAYIPVGDIEIGEPLRNKDSKNIAIKSKTKKEGRDTVYNLEVYRDHNFMVGYSGLLVHNSCTEKFLKSVGVEESAIIKWKNNGIFSKRTHVLQGKAKSSLKELEQCEAFGVHVEEDIVMLGTDINNKSFQGIDATFKDSGKMISFKEVENLNPNSLNTRIKEAYNKIKTYNDNPIYTDISKMEKVDVSIKAKAFTKQEAQAAWTNRSSYHYQPLSDTDGLIDRIFIECSDGFIKVK